jgi:hypothetical protein
LDYRSCLGDLAGSHLKVLTLSGTGIKKRVSKSFLNANPWRSACALNGGGVAAFTPFASVFNNPVRQRALEADVMADFFGFDPFMPENFVPFRLEFAVKGRPLY